MVPERLAGPESPGGSELRQGECVTESAVAGGRISTPDFI